MAEAAVTNENFDTIVKQADVAVVDFFADWCGPCRMMAPVIEKVAEEYEGRAVVGKCNVDQAREIAGRFGIRSIPTLVFFKAGAEVDRHVGYVDYDGLKAKLDAQL